MQETGGLEDTGERIIPHQMKLTNMMLIEHYARYHFACDFVKGDVLDIACGTGYGSHMMAKKCKDKVDEIIGVDIDQATIDYAKHTYYHPLTSFHVGDARDADLVNEFGQFDTIISFETIEHFKNERPFLTNLYQLLKPGGTLVLSTPFGKGRGISSGVDFHYHQFTYHEFQTMFRAYDHVQYYFQEGPLVVPESYASNRNYPLGIVVCQK